MVGEKMKADNIKGDKMKGWWGDKTMRDQMKGDKMKGQKMKTDEMKGWWENQPPASRDSTQELSVVGDAGMAGEGTKQNDWRQDEGMMGNKMMRTWVHSQKLGSKPLY